MIVLLLAAALGAAAPAPVLTGPQALEQGRAHYRAADFEGAIPMFQRAVMATPDTDPATKAQAEVWLGLSFLNIGNADLAKSSFRAALLANPSARLPEDAPPAAIPMFANIQGELARAQRQLEARPRPSTGPRPSTAARPEPARTDVPPAVVDNPAPASEEISLDEPTLSEPASGPRYPRWIPNVVAGVGVGLALTAGGLKLASNASLNGANAAADAPQTLRLSRRGDTEQHLARALGIAALGTVAVAVVLYAIDR